MKSIITIVSVALLFWATSCEKKPAGDVKPDIDNAVAQERSDNGSRQMIQDLTAFYNTQRFNVRTQRYQSKTYLGKQEINRLYVISEPQLGGTSTKRFLPAVDKLPSGSFSISVLWQQVNIVFGPSLIPYQIQSSEEVEKLLSMPNPPIALQYTDAFFKMAMSYALDPNSK
jgi:hypothetical protein